MSLPPQLDRQREHQANERTFLAWLRTAVALIGFGLAIARFGLFVQQLQVVIAPSNPPFHTWFNSETIGVSLIAVGMLLVVLAAWNYNRVFWQIEQGNYRPSRLMVWITAGVVLVLGLLSIPFVLWRPAPNAKPAAFHQFERKIYPGSDLFLTEGIKNYFVNRLL